MKEQVTCFVQEDGAGIKFMHEYDNLSDKVRRRLSESKYNLCVMCVKCQAGSLHHTAIYAKGSYPRPLDYYYIQAINEMEKGLDDERKSGQRYFAGAERSFSKASGLKDTYGVISRSISGNSSRRENSR